MIREPGLELQEILWHAWHVSDVADREASLLHLTLAKIVTLMDFLRRSGD